MRAVNLLPSDLRGAVKASAPVTPAPADSGGSGAFFALGALALCVLGFAGYTLTANSIEQHQADLAALESRRVVAMTETARLKPYADFETVATTRIATVRDLATQRFDWELALRDLSRALPQDVSVNQLAASVSSKAGGGGALRGAIDAPAIELTGCTADQPSVAALMARLRAVNGVTRVSLASAAKSESASSAAGAPAPGAPLAGCEGKGSSDPADFNLVVFFEHSAGASVDPSAPAQPTTAAPGAGTTPEAGGTAAAPPATAAPTTEPADAGTSVPTSTEAE